jgi:hypothetical protein
MDGFDVENTDDQNNNVDNESHREAILEAKELLQKLTREGLKIVFDAPLPVFRITRIDAWTGSIEPTPFAGTDLKCREPR